MSRLITPENIIVALIGLGAVWFLLRRLLRSPQSPECGKGCGCGKIRGDERDR